jgi:alpha-methylacyl-CoA racemase
MGALSNLKVLDLSTLLPGPFATMMLADLGADVLRVESASRPDLCRIMPPFANGISTKHAALNRNKRAITLDLKNPAAISLIERIIAEYDILIEQFRPGVMDRLGLGYDRLKEINPRLIYCSITGYGQTGPYKSRAGHDNNYISISGLNSYSGHAGKTPPLMGTQIADIAGGSLHGVIGILAAVNERHVSNLGQHIDVSMTDATFTLNAMFGSDFLATGKAPQQEAEILNGGGFYDYYETSDGRYISVGSLEPQFFQRLCTGLGSEELSGDDLLALGSKQDAESQNLFKTTITGLFKKKTLAEWGAIFDDKDACIEPVNTLPEACENPQIVAREMVVNVPLRDGGTQRQIACPIKMSNSPASYKFTGGPLGEHNEEILQSLNLSDQEIADIKSSGAMD